MTAWGRAGRRDGERPNSGVYDVIRDCPKLKPPPPLPHYAGAYSTEDESGWESEVSVEESELEVESEVERDDDDDGFEADSEGEYAWPTMTKTDAVLTNDVAANPNVDDAPFPGGFCKFYYVPSTGEFVALEEDGGSHDDVGEEEKMEGDSDTEVDDDDDGGGSRGGGGDEDVVADEGSEPSTSDERGAAPENAPRTPSAEETDQTPPANCPIENAERNLNLLIGVIAETQRHLDEIFSKHNIQYDYSIADEEDSVNNETDAKDSSAGSPTSKEEIRTEVPIQTSEEGGLSAVEAEAATEEKLVPTTRESATVAGELAGGGTTPAETDLTSVEDESARVVSAPSKETPTETPAGRAGKESPPVEVAASPTMVEESSPRSEESGWVRTETGWVIKRLDSTEISSREDEASPLAGSVHSALDAQPGERMTGKKPRGNFGRVLWVPFISLVCSLGALNILARYNLAFLLATAAMVLVFSTTILACLVHLRQIFRSRAIENPFQVILDLRLNSAFSAAVVPRFSRAISAFSHFLEFLRRAYLFRNLFDTAKLILVTGVLYLVGDWFTVPRLVLAFNLYFSLSQLKSSHFLQSSTLFSKVKRRYF